MSRHLHLATELVSRLRDKGADAADVYVASSDGFNTTVRLGEIEKLQRSTARGLGLRVFSNGATASTFTTDFRDEAISSLIDETMEIVKVSSPDEFNGLAPKELLGSYEGPLDLFDESIASLTPEEKIARVRAMEAAGRAFDPRITNSNGASWSDSVTEVVLANSDGFSGSYVTSRVSMSVYLLAEEDGVKQRDGWFSMGRYLSRLEDAESIGVEAARRAVKRLGGRKIKSRTLPVVISPEVSGDFVEMLFGSASGGSIYRRSSCLVDKLGEEIASPLVTIVDDATMRDGLASRPFDGEGVRSAPLTIVKEGRLETYVCDSYAARRLGMRVTGSTARGYQSAPSVGSSNLFMVNGESDPSEILKTAGSGLYLTEMFGSGVNGVTGDFSQGASGFWIEDGEITYPVQEITIAGNLLKVLQDVKMVGNDLSFRYGSTAAPTLLIGAMTVGGE